MPELQPKKPIEKKKFSLNDFKKKVGGEDVPDKPLTWFECSKAFQQATGLPGFPKGYVSLSRGFTNTGKSTSISEAVVAAQKQGVLPIIIDTENNLGRDRLAKIGFDWDNDFYIDIDNQYILDNFGKKKDKDKKEASIEDLGDCINYFIDQQEAGQLPYDLLFMIDSLGTLDCNMTIAAKSNDTNQNNMWNAGAFERAFKSLVNYRIPNSRKVSFPYTNTMIAVQKIWTQGSAPMITVKHKGGEAFAYGARLIYHHGGIMAHGTKAIGAKFGDKEILYGIKANIEVFKNQVGGPLGGISLAGNIISTPHGFIGADKTSIDEYKKKHIGFFKELLGKDVTAEEIETKLVDINQGEED
jgi:hypothetical protein